MIKASSTLSKIIERIRNPYYRFQIRPTYWRSVWIHWGWTCPALRRIRLFDGDHLWLSLGLVSFVLSKNIGRPGTVLMETEGPVEAGDLVVVDSKTYKCRRAGGGVS